MIYFFVIVLVGKYVGLVDGVILGWFVGDNVFAIGTPLSKQLGQTVSKGIISGHRYMYNTNLIQTDVSINHGNSGGALINERGELVGVPTFKLSRSEGMGFCFPSDRMPW